MTSKNIYLNDLLQKLLYKTPIPKNKVIKINLNKESLELHKKHHGKISINIKTKVNNTHDLSVVYTPGVAEPCRAIAKDKNKVYDYTIKQNTVAVVTDGSAVLGLGNIGPEAALPVMEGKCVLFKELADIDAFPICIGTQDTEEIIKFVKNLAPVFGGINLEDIAAPKCFEIEEALQDIGIPVYHDDQHGTAIITLAGLINAAKLAGKDIKKLNIAMSGAGAAGIAMLKLFDFYGIDLSNSLVCDSRGIIYKGREGLNKQKEEIAEITNKNLQKGELKDAFKDKDVFIGVSAANIVTKEMIKDMNEKPIIFAMANPDPEIMPDDARQAGAFIVGTGRSDFPNQINNSLGFPGLFKGALAAKAKRLTNEMKAAAAEAIAGCVENPTVDKVVPDALDKKVPIRVAEEIKKNA